MIFPIGSGILYSAYICLYNIFGSNLYLHHYFKEEEKLISMAQSGQQQTQILPLPDFLDENDPLDDELTPKPTRSRRRMVIIISAILLVIIILGIVFFATRGSKPITYQSQAVKQGNLTFSISATGPLQANVYSLNFTGTGKLSEIDVQVGQVVKAGQTVGKLDATSLQNALNESQASILSAQTSLGNAQANYGAAVTSTKASLDAAQTSLNDAVTNLNEVQTQTRANISSAQTSLNDAQSSLGKVQAQSQASLDAAQTALDNAKTNLTNVQAQTNAQLAVALTQEQQAITACNSALTPTPNCVQLAQNQYAQVQATAATSVASAQ